LLHIPRLKRRLFQRLDPKLGCLFGIANVLHG
jgi:hypothetical protein